MELFDYEKKHLETLRPSLAECCVLLQKNGQFPLKEACSILAIGPGVRNTLKGGTGSGEVNSRFFVNVEEGLTAAGFTLYGSDWSDAYEAVRKDAHKQFVKTIKARARKEHVLSIIYAMGAVMPEPEYDPIICDEGNAQAAIYVLSRICGEGSDRQNEKGDFLLTDTEVRDILDLNARYDKFMLVLNVGGPVDLTPVLEVGNILVLSQLGVETGAVLADILLGKTSPSGKLTTTWASAEDYSPELEFGQKSDTHYYEGIYVGYRYFDSVSKEPLFPFGYGLSYTEFELGKPQVTVQKTKVNVKLDVKNIGDFAAKEIVQLYLSKRSAAFQDLCAFKKTALIAPGKKETIEISFDMTDMASFDEENHCYSLPCGDYVLRMGQSSKTQPIVILQLDNTVVVRKVRPIAGDCGFDPKYYSMNMEVLPKLPVLKLNASDFVTQTVCYDQTIAIDDKVKTLSDEDLCLLNIGIFNPKGGLTSIVGNAAQTVSGAAGETAKGVKGFKNLVMADGPAGLRLNRKFFVDEKGVHAIEAAMMPESFMEFMPKIARWFIGILSKSDKVPAEDQIQYQYATAIPIGTALAQSFNTEFVENCGDVVGAEMERFGVHLWLAPALNIHRSVLCGRNFEYYSEDPLVSGKMAAAMTLGVQKHPGCCVTIKHFCCNNQELNRVNSNSCVSERALREIYLKGFEIAIKESAPVALMTAYNLLNGVHTNEHKGLLQDFLRSECGYQGIIMTDWTIAAASSELKPKYPQTNSVQSAAAGNMLFMPGSKADYKLLLKSLRKGKIAREDLEKNVSWFLKNTSLLELSK